MELFEVSLFGKFQIQHLGQLLVLPGKAMEFLGYLLLYPDRPHHRETLAYKLWHDEANSNPKKQLRYVLWQTKNILAPYIDSTEEGIFKVEDNWIQIRSGDKIRLDVNLFRKAYNTIREIPGKNLDLQTEQILRQTANLYQGDLLEGFYSDWCLFEREQFKDMLIVMLGKLVEYYEAHKAYENAFEYGARILRQDPLHEGTHRRLMRMHFYLGNRTSALRQYQRFVSMLKNDMGVGPANRTEKLYDQIRDGTLDETNKISSSTKPKHLHESRALFGLLEQLNKIQNELQITQKRVEEEIRKLDQSEY